MKSIILVLALCVCASFAYDLEEYTWEGFKKIHKRTYVGVEEMMREKIFEDNLQRITDFNAEDHSYTLGVNQFSDLTNLEFRQMMLGYDNEARLKLKTNDQQHVCSMHVDDLPTSVDWRTKGVVTGVKNQRQCGSCWSFSATGSTEGQYAMKHGNLTSFSEQQLMDCSRSEGNHGCQGGLMDFAFKYLEKTADEMETDYPYQAKNERCRAVSSKEIAKLSSYRDIQRDSITDLMEAVATIGPISVAMDASKLSHYNGGVYDPSSCSATKLDHGVLAVGYGTEDGKDYWLIKNSWGESWGEKGYFRIIRNVNTCGICTQASYPVVM